MVVDASKFHLNRKERQGSSDFPLRSWRLGGEISPIA
jgi:hypothetical protein